MSYLPLGLSALMAVPVFNSRPAAAEAALRILAFPNQRAGAVKLRCLALFVLALFVGSPSWGANSAAPDFTGPWNITVQFADGTASAVLTLNATNGGGYEGSSGPLDEVGGFSLHYTGVLDGSSLVLTSAVPGPLFPESVGTLRIQMTRNGLRGTGSLYKVPVTLKGTRPTATAHEPTTYDYVPTRYFTKLSSTNPPVLHIFPGDSVRTSTIDANGQDENQRWASMPGNPQTGPFFVEGAMPGDTLAVHLTRVRPNQKRAEMVCWTLHANALPAGTARFPFAPCSLYWNLDAEQNTAAPSEPGPRLKNFKVALRPMIGTIGVAPPSNQAIGATLIGQYGGNLDYNRITEGVTLYLPVYRAGALLSLGDAHAAQGDGEITSQGLETSMSVEFKVDLIKGKSLGRPWAEDDQYVMVSGIGHSLSESLQAATGGMLDWLKEHYQLEITDSTLVLGTSIEYDIASVLGAPHVVAKIRKDTLALIQSPEP